MRGLAGGPGPELSGLPPELSRSRALSSTLVIGDVRQRSLESTQIICIIRQQRPIRAGVDEALLGAKGLLDSRAPARHGNQTFRFPVRVSGRGRESRVCALDRMRGSSFVMRGDVCGSRSYPLPHTLAHTGTQPEMVITLLHSHCQGQFRGVILLHPITPLFGVYNHFLTHERQTRLSSLHLFPAPPPFF